MSSDPERKQVLDESKALMEELNKLSEAHDTPKVLLAAQLLIAYRAVRDRMPLQELMQNLLQNIPAMYAIVIQAEFPEDLVAVDEKGKVEA